MNCEQRFVWWQRSSRWPDPSLSFNHWPGVTVEMSLPSFFWEKQAVFPRRQNTFKNSRYKTSKTHFSPHHLKCHLSTRSHAVYTLQNFRIQARDIDTILIQFQSRRVDPAQTKTWVIASAGWTVWTRCQHYRAVPAWGGWRCMLITSGAGGRALQVSVP